MAGTTGRPARALPADSHHHPAGAEEALRDLEGRARPASVFQLAEAPHAAEGIVLAAPDADALVRNASRGGSKLLEWYAAGQMIARERTTSTR